MRLFYRLYRGYRKKEKRGGRERKSSRVLGNINIYFERNREAFRQVGRKFEGKEKKGRKLKFIRRKVS